MRGQLILACPEDYIFSELDAITSLEKAIELDPSYIEAYEQFGHRHDGLREDPEKAMEYYRMAAKLSGKTLD